MGVGVGVGQGVGVLEGVTEGVGEAEEVVEGGEEREGEEDGRGETVPPAGALAVPCCVGKAVETELVVTETLGVPSTTLWVELWEIEGEIEGVIDWRRVCCVEGVGRVVEVAESVGFPVALPG